MSQSLDIQIKFPCIQYAQMAHDAIYGDFYGYGHLSTQDYPGLKYLGPEYNETPVMFGGNNGILDKGDILAECTRLAEELTISFGIWMKYDEDFIIVPEFFGSDGSRMEHEYLVNKSIVMLRKLRAITDGPHTLGLAMLEITKAMWGIL